MEFFEEIKQGIMNLADNTHFLKLKTTVETNASQNGHGASLEQLRETD